MVYVLFFLAFPNIVLRCSMDTVIRLGETNHHCPLSRVSHELFQKVALGYFFFFPF